ncbi:MAG: Asp-tRNA(Asn)/Glu-tRNA(Gln) amidotransferase subunit GatB, partial [Methylophilaceae bacterium]
MTWDIVIGIETHVQLTTKTKIFSGASTEFGLPANENACLVSLAYPGTLPVLNKEAVMKAIKFGLAVNAQIAEYSVFARKNYFYPDLPKGYQISQFELPVVNHGYLEINNEGVNKKIRILRAHLEEDAGKSVHGIMDNKTGIDLNRAGTPLLEIVTEPDMSSAKEAIAYAKKLHNLVQWIGICDGNMQEGSFRCDVNVSVKPSGSDKLGTRREIKNLNSFRYMEQAINYEVSWQIEQIEDGHDIIQSTVLFNPDSGET